MGQKPSAVKKVADYVQSSVQKTIDQSIQKFEKKFSFNEIQRFKHEQMINKINSIKFNLFPNQNIKQLFITKFKEAFQQNLSQFSFLGLRYFMPYNQKINQIVKSNLEISFSKYLEHQTKFNQVQLKRMLENGRILLNNKKIDPNNLDSTLVKKGDKVLFKATYHIEPPQLDLNMKLVFEKQVFNENIIGLFKPCGINVHQRSIFQKNTIFNNLKNIKPNFQDFTPLEFIPRLSSGLVLATFHNFKGSSQQNRLELLKKFHIYNVNKKAYARVYGRFPEKTLYQIYCPKMNKIIQNENFFSIEEALKKDDSLSFGPLSQRKQVFEYKLLSYDPKTNTSLINCTILQGMSVDLSANLKRFGYPIMNEICNNGNAFNFQLLKSMSKHMTEQEIRQYEITLNNILQQKRQFHKNWYDGKIGNFSAFNWNVYIVFESFLHTYSYEYKVDNESQPTIFELDKTFDPYWLNENELNYQQNDKS